MFAAASLGAVTVALNGWWIEDELAYALGDSGARTLVVDDRLFPRVARLLTTLPGLQEVFWRGAGTPPPGTEPLGALVAASPEVPADPLDEDDAFVIL